MESTKTTTGLRGAARRIASHANRLWEGFEWADATLGAILLSPIFIAVELWDRRQVKRKRDSDPLDPRETPYEPGSLDDSETTTGGT
ncbi:hypothetical protein Bequi_09825 [Brachybacterium sp. JHP9]|uniref:Uncharacterized protein n=1 Tax=Brachybacterium equifaecis TaxID=2910770 RepID=A0ABT0R1B3_9MICO|nr:hypothetical protein [Brachybacterium equifaecis]MCL6423681.1 hypothetical protein [Brachybacterium equifaecis]